MEDDVGLEIETERQALVVEIAPFGDDGGLRREVGILRQRLIEHDLVDRLYGRERAGIRVPGRDIRRVGHRELAFGSRLRQHDIG